MIDPTQLRDDAAFLRRDETFNHDEYADRIDATAAVLEQIPPRLLRVFDALATITTPDGWETHLWDGGVYGITARRAADGHCKTILPSTDGTPRWYLGLHDEYNGHMAADAQDAVDWTVDHSPELNPHHKGHRPLTEPRTLEELVTAAGDSEHGNDLLVGELRAALDGLTDDTKVSLDIRMSEDVGADGETLELGVASTANIAFTMASDTVPVEYGGTDPETEATVPVLIITNERPPWL